MKKITINQNEAGQRFDKLLRKYLNQAPSSFIYKMLRKKNIKLNGKKASGNEMLVKGDIVEIFLSDDTYQKFSTIHNIAEENKQSVYRNVTPLKKNWIIYEDEHICLLNKPHGILSQKASQNDVSINEMFISYLLKEKQITEEELQTFHPSVCNRLDRNTSGLLICGKTLPGLQHMAAELKKRELKKYYWCIVKGILKEPQLLNGFLVKDETNNKVTVVKTGREDAKPIQTSYTPIGYGENMTLLEVHLITGRTHQIRAHLSSIGHPILGDIKYGDPQSNAWLREHYLFKDQMLHARRLEFPVYQDRESICIALSEKVFTAPLPDLFLKVIREEITCQPGILVD